MGRASARTARPQARAGGAKRRRAREDEPEHGRGGATLLVLENTDFTYDVVDNPVGLKDWRIPNEWPAGAKPVSRIAEYDDLYRVSNVQFQYEGGDDTWVSPFDAENNELSDDPKLATPSPHVSFDKRVLSQSFTYDWLGNTTHTSDDANGFYDRSLGTITNGTATAGPYQLQSASIGGSPGPARAGSLTAAYDAAGNLTSLAVHRNGPCLPAGATCGQRFVYDWDEVGRLVRARRWDLADPGAASDATPSDPADADLAYAYDANDMRVRKSATNDADTVHSLYPLPTLEVQRTTYAEPGGYALSAESEVAYLAAGSVTVGRLAYESTDVPTTVGEGRLHVFLTLADYLGSTSTVVDLASSEVVERTTYTPYGGTESDYRPARWEWSRETRRFTGKDEDVEVGLQYFGARFYSAALGRWVSADPAVIQTLAAEPNAYAYVIGRALRGVDPIGLSWWDTVTSAVSDAAGAAWEGVKNVNKGFTDKVVAIADKRVVQPLKDTAIAAANGNWDGVIKGAAQLYGVAQGVPTPGGELDATIGFAKELHDDVDGVVQSLKQGDVKQAEVHAGGVYYDLTVAALALVGLAEVGELVEPELESLGETNAERQLTNCFAAGTPVATPGGLVAIEQLRVGDLVWSREPETGAIAAKRVVKRFATAGRELLEITVEGSRGRETIRTTAGHPFRVLARASHWQYAGTLQPGDTLEPIS